MRALVETHLCHPLLPFSTLAFSDVCANTLYYLEHSICRFHRGKIDYSGLFVALKQFAPC